MPSFIHFLLQVLVFVLTYLIVQAVVYRRIPHRDWRARELHSSFAGLMSAVIALVAYLKFGKPYVLQFLPLP